MTLLFFYEKGFHPSDEIEKKIDELDWTIKLPFGKKIVLDIQKIDYTKKRNIATANWIYSAPWIAIRHLKEQKTFMWNDINFANILEEIKRQSKIKES